MNEDIDKLNLWTARNIVRRLDIANEQLGAMKWAGYPPVFPVIGGDGGSEVHGGNEVVDEWQRMSNGGFYQDPKTMELRLGPLIMYPGVMLAPWVETPIVPGPNRELWVKVSYDMKAETLVGKNGRSTKGWDGTLNNARAEYIWTNAGAQLHDNNVIFESTYEDSLPPGGTFIKYSLFGYTNGLGFYNHQEKSGYWEICNMWVPVFE